MVRQGGTVGDKTSLEIIVTSAYSLIDAVAAILGSKRPSKRLTPNQRAFLVERGRHFRFLRKDGQTRGWWASSTEQAFSSRTRRRCATDVSRPRCALEILVGLTVRQAHRTIDVLGSSPSSTSC